MRKLLKRIKRMIYFAVFKINLIISCIPARLRWDRLSRKLQRANARRVLSARHGQRKIEMEEIGNEWKRMFPLKGMQEILAVDADTIYARTHGWCPLRGTGDVRACFQLMEFDRALLETIGGQFVVLRSQAQPGVKTCDIAIRRLGKSIDDLVPAYKQIQ